MQNVLVLGGTQFFGKRLVQMLIDHGKNVTIATRGLTKDSFGDSVERLIIDREKKETIVQAFENRTRDVVYDQSCFSPQEVKDVLDVLKGKVKRYIFTSSQAVYEFGTNHKEEHFSPINFSFMFKGRREYVGYGGYQEAKRAAENVLFTQSDMEVVAVRFPIVVGTDDYTNRLKFYVDKVKNEEPIVAENFDIKLGFILSKEAAEFLYFLGESSFQGPINAGSLGDISLLELIRKIEVFTGREAILSNDVVNQQSSPYSLAGSWSVNPEMAIGLGFQFSDLNLLLDDLINFYNNRNGNEHLFFTKNNVRV